MKRAGRIAARNRWESVLRPAVHRPYLLSLAMGLTMKRIWVAVLASLVLGLAGVSAWLEVAAQTGAAPPRATPPTFDRTETSRVFFDDVFTKLQGERPQNLGAVAVRSPTSPAAGDATNAAASGTASGDAWSKVISPTTIEDEVKSLKMSLDQAITTPSKFAGLGYKEARRDFSVLAVLFGIVAEYDSDVRWRDESPVARDAFARSAANTKAGGNSNTYNESKRRKDDLQTLLNGSRIEGTADSEETDWSTLVDVGPLMQRLDQGFNGKLAKLVSSKDAFEANIEEVLHEAEVSAAIGRVLTLEGMDNWDDETYADFAQRLTQASLDVVAAVRVNNYDQARQAAGEINKACSECHDFYR